MRASNTPQPSRPNPILATYWTLTGGAVTEKGTGTPPALQCARPDLMRCSPRCQASPGLGRFAHCCLDAGYESTMEWTHP